MLYSDGLMVFQQGKKDYYSVEGNGYSLKYQSSITETITADEDIVGFNNYTINSNGYIVPNDAAGDSVYNAMTYSYFIFGTSSDISNTTTVMKVVSVDQIDYRLILDCDVYTISADSRYLVSEYKIQEQYNSYINAPWSNHSGNIVTEFYHNNINVKSKAYWFTNCYNLTGSPVCGVSVQNMHSTYLNCYNLTGSPVCGDNVQDMSYTYWNCYNLTGSPVCGDNVQDMYGTYYNCRNLTGSPVCGDKVINMANAYYGCNKLTGIPVCGNNVTNMIGSYYYCRNLTGSPVCGDNVINMYNAYTHCNKLTGSPVCGDKVINLASA